MNESKFVFGERRQKFSVFEFSEEGFLLDIKKFEALINAKAPSTVGENA